MAVVNITIIGTGRIGASLGLALQAYSKRGDAKHQFVVTGYDRKVARLRAAAKLGAVEAEVPEITNAVSRADLVFLAMPYGEAKELYELMGAALKPGAVVVDTAPLKLPPQAWADRHFPRDPEDGSAAAYLVGVLPVINPDYLGDPDDSPEGARADLFTGGLMILSPAANCPPEAVQLVSDLTELLGIRIHFVDPHEHDGIIAGTEGLPALLQVAYFQSLSRANGWADAGWISNPAFFLATYKLLDSDPETLAAELHDNRANLLRRIDALSAALHALRDTLTHENSDALADLIDESARKYRVWANQRERNKWETDIEPEATEQGAKSRFSMLGFGSLLPSIGGRKKGKK
ncbi:MAG TPA: prephenate dehydrogenase/arogenate dehydrogenase family protein [Aggregatilineales bacterium]|nr:prephenate dehydrogenase [Anaerolineales bacterium]HRE49179.1 prephenate dehydrogenase/arogenate dehydrogenase family protein [Aggregatilineales bacterium]